MKTLKRLLFLVVVCLSACTSAGPTPGTPIPTATSLLPNTPTATPAPTVTPTASPTPPDLPATFQTRILNPLDTPHTYVTDSCTYLRNKWSSYNSPPGTTVMVIMFHSITGGTITNANQTSETYFRTLMNDLHTAGFQAIDTAQLVGFLESNSRIPPLSVLLVVDDRHPAYYFNTLFRQYWDEWSWPVVNAWISNAPADLWSQQQVLNSEGWVDYEAHGVVHNIPIGPNSTDAYIMGELQGSILAFQKYFQKTPLAYIWPGGGFTPHAVNIARQLGYELGFTTNPRGPLMYNWIPLDDKYDPGRPTWLPEGNVNDPLMVLPRYWDTDATLHIPQVVQISQAAAAYAVQNKSTELEYYDSVCAPTYGPVP
jgi:hypothetical protein